MDMEFHIRQILIAVDQLCNAVLGGWADETLSSRCWRLSLAGRGLPRRIVDGIFFREKDHCFQAYESERLGRQLPPELRRG